jgi:hypothetical protein
MVATLLSPSSSSFATQEARAKKATATSPSSSSSFVALQCSPAR